jgi:hypothetical protein
VAYHYRAYGLHLCSELLLPEVACVGEDAASTAADVVIRRGALDRPATPATPATPPTAADTGGDLFAAEEARFAWPGVGAFLVRGGNEVVVDADTDVEERVLRLPLLGVVMAALIHQRGALVLHASAVSLGGSAVAFAAHKGGGKSTTAAALYARGHALVTDDVLAVDRSSTGTQTARPGVPLLKLWPQAATAVGEDPEQLVRLAPGAEKRLRLVHERFEERRLPLKCLIVLSVGEARRLTVLRPNDALVAVVTHSYLARFARRQVDGDIARSLFHRCTSFLASVPVYLLERPASLAAVPALAAFLEEQLSGDGV